MWDCREGVIQSLLPTLNLHRYLPRQIVFISGISVSPSETAPELLYNIHVSGYILLREEEKHPSNRWCWVL